MADEHKETIGHGEFCARRKTGKCCDGNDYQKCTQDWKSDWGASVYAKYNFVESSKGKRTFEAHHMLCVASVTQHLCGGSKGDSPIIEIIRETKWCINAEKNMIALPLWGHTVKFYCDLETGKLKVMERVTGKKVDAEPPFADLPQHDYDHNSGSGYKKSDVDTEIKAIANKIKGKKAKHEAAKKDLKASLDTASDDMRDLLIERGGRSKGTHAAWKDGHVNPTGEWYLPFSMADDGGADARTFPVAGGRSKLASKIAKLADRYKKWGAT